MTDRKIMKIAEVDAAELAVRMCEASYNLRRPKPSARHALDAMDEEVREGWLRAAHAAMKYWQECLTSAREPS